MDNKNLRKLEDTFMPFTQRDLKLMVRAFDGPSITDHRMGELYYAAFGALNRKQREAQGRREARKR